MPQETSLLTALANPSFSCEKTTPFPATNGYYRSRIYTSNININPLIGACDQLLSLITALKTTEYPDDPEQFLQDLAHEIRSFEHRAQIANYGSNTIIAARYALCCLVDETIQLTPWGQKNSWHEKNLLALFYHEHDGNERFFQIVERSLEKIEENLHLIELLYLCLNLGFGGKQRHTADGQNELVALTNKLYQIIGQSTQLNCKNILIQEIPVKIPQPQQPATSTKTTVDSKMLFGMTATVAIIISGLIYIATNLKLTSINKNIYTALEPFIDNKSTN